MIDALATREIYFRNLLPIWQALPEHHRGTLYVGGHLVGTEQARLARARPKDMTLLSPGPRVLVASQLDYQTVASHRRVIHAQHGSGQSYGGDSDPGVNRALSYAGGDNQDRTDLFIVPGPHPAQRCKARYPHIPVAEVGCPALDRWLTEPRPSNPEPVVALAWHWENPLCPESRTALPHFRPALPDLASRYRVIGHSHPRAASLVAGLYESLNTPFVDYETVMRTADVLVVDNSSIGFEFAATGRPVVWLTPPWYRRDVDHGLRFWDAVGCGIEVTDPADLLGAIAAALGEPPPQWDHFLRFLGRVYAHLDGRSGLRAAAAIVALDDPQEAESMLTLTEVPS